MRSGRLGACHDKAENLCGALAFSIMAWIGFATLELAPFPASDFFEHAGFYQNRHHLARWVGNAEDFLRSGG